MQSDAERKAVQAEYYKNTRVETLKRQKRRYRQTKVSRLRNRLLTTTKHRAKKFGIYFDLSLDDIQVPSMCPILHIPLVLGTENAGPQSPTLDRFVPELGYVGFNVNVISQKANSIKGHASLPELRARLYKMRLQLADLECVVRYMEKNNK